MKKIFFYLTGLMIFIGFENSFAQNPAYTLTANNLHCNYYINQLEWDIYLLHTNPPIEFEYSAGEYFFDFGPNVIIDGGALTYSIVGSDLPPNLRPGSSSVYLQGGERQLRLFSNQPPIPGSGYIMTNNGNSNGGKGTLIARVRLTTTTYFDAFSNDLNITWRNGPTNPYVKIFAYVGQTGINITMPNLHSTNVHFPGHTNVASISKLLYEPVYGTSAVSSPVNFSWSNNINSDKLEISTDYEFNNIVASVYPITDTFYTVSGLNPSTKYYWHVSGFINFPNCYCINSAISTFTTNRGISVFLKLIKEGLYNSTTGLLNRNDSVTLFIRDVSSPFAIRDSTKSIIDSLNFTGLFSFPLAPSGTYYIVVKSSNGLETWSKAGVNIGVNTAYDFTTSASQAFGNNMKQVEMSPALFAIFSGEVNQDGNIDLTDLILVYNNASNFIEGYFATDLNGDNLTDLEDVLITFNNTSKFISVIKP